MTTRISQSHRARLAWLLACASLAVARGEASPPVRRSIPDLGGRPIVILIAVGELRVQAWAQPGVEVEIVPEGRAAREAEALSMTVDDTPEALTVRVEQPKDGKDPALKARVTLRVPAAASLQRIEVFEGSIEIDGVRGLLQAKVERGPIRARRLAGTIRLETGSGDLTVSEAELVQPGLLRLRTFNGHIALGLVRRPSDARVLALTLNGTIRSELPLEQRTGFGPRFGEAVIGSGESLISLDAVRGNITITVPASR